MFEKVAVRKRPKFRFSSESKKSRFGSASGLAEMSGSVVSYQQYDNRRNKKKWTEIIVKAKCCHKNQIQVSSKITVSFSSRRICDRPSALIPLQIIPTTNLHQSQNYNCKHGAPYQKYGTILSACLSRFASVFKCAKSVFVSRKAYSWKGLSFLEENQVTQYVLLELCSNC